MRNILFFTIPAFPVAVARVVDCTLRDRPAVIAATSSDRALIQAASSEANREGVFAGMPIYRAIRRCPQLRISPPDPLLLRRARAALDRLLGSQVPLQEPVAAGASFLDVSGCSRLLGPGRDIAARLEKEASQQLRLTGHVGVAGNKLVSRIAAGYLHRPGVCDVFPGSEAAFMAPLPINCLPGIGRQRQLQLLQDLDLHRIGELATLSVAQLALIFGSLAPLLHQRAQGVDFAPVRAPKRQPGISAESILPRTSNSLLLLRGELCRMVEECGYRLRQQQRTARRLSLQLNFQDGVSRQGSSSLPGGFNQDRNLLKVADPLLIKLLDRRIQLRSLQLRCLDLTGPGQLELFTMTHQREDDTLQDALDRVRGRFGTAAIQRGRVLSAPGHLDS